MLGGKISAWKGNTVKVCTLFMWYVEFFFFNGVFLKVLELEKVVVCVMIHCSLGVFVLIFQTCN